jgi:hypothetical protein
MSASYGMSGLALSWVSCTQELLTSYIMQSAIKDGLPIIRAFPELLI